MSTRLVLATRNEHKVHELRQILGDLVGELDLDIVSAAEVDGPVVPETEVTFEGNARLKAVALAEATGLPSVADDSGLAVEVLGGAPGVWSAGWSGSFGGGPDAPRAQRDAANLRLLLDQLAEVSAEHRAAAFVCTAVLAMPDGRTAVATGRVTGHLAFEPAGTNGFGYDPIFVPDGQSRTLAEHSDEEKNAISHRGNAFRAMIPILREHLG